MFTIALFAVVAVATAIWYFWLRDAIDDVATRPLDKVLDRAFESKAERELRQRSSAGGSPPRMPVTGRASDGYWAGVVTVGRTAVPRGGFVPAFDLSVEPPELQVLAGDGPTPQDFEAAGVSFERRCESERVHWSAPSQTGGTCRVTDSRVVFIGEPATPSDGTVDWDTALIPVAQARYAVTAPLRLDLDAKTVSFGAAEQHGDDPEHDSKLTIVFHTAEAAHSAFAAIALRSCRYWLGSFDDVRPDKRQALQASAEPHLELLEQRRAQYGTSGPPPGVTSIGWPAMYLADYWE